MLFFFFPEVESQELFAPGLALTVILLISASPVAVIASVSHWHLAKAMVLKNCVCAEFFPLT
jgi:hypothetical protein